MIFWSSHIFQQYCGDRAKVSRLVTLVTGHCDQRGSGWRCYVVCFLNFHGKCRKHGRIGKWRYIWNKNIHFAIIFWESPTFRSQGLCVGWNVWKTVSIACDRRLWNPPGGKYASFDVNSFFRYHQTEQKEEQHGEQIVWLQARNKIEPTKRKIVRKVAWIADSMDIMDSMDSGWPSWSLANRFCGFRDSAALSWANGDTVHPGPRSTPINASNQKAKQVEPKLVQTKNTKTKWSKSWLKWTYQTLQMIYKNSKWYAFDETLSIQIPHEANTVGVLGPESGSLCISKSDTIYIAKSPVQNRQWQYGIGQNLDAIVWKST